jgi:hypothetical protein
VLSTLYVPALHSARSTIILSVVRQSSPHFRVNWQCVLNVCCVAIAKLRLSKSSFAKIMQVKLR